MSTMYAELQCMRLCVFVVIPSLMVYSQDLTPIMTVVASGYAIST